ncbi:MAG: hypothetical protein ACOY40_00765 [Bacillota bacterium]
MAVSLREYPVIKGKAAERFLDEKKKTEELLAKIADQYKRDPASVKVLRKHKGICICNPK